MSVKYTDGSEYRGAWSSDGQRHGLGHMTFCDGSQYRGQFHNGACHGFGVMAFKDHSLYTGEFELGQFAGHGVFNMSDGVTYVGQFNDGKVSGLGLMTFADGSHGQPRCEGMFENNRLVQRQNCQVAIETAHSVADRARQIQSGIS